MSIPRNLGNFADNVNANGKVEVTGINATGTPSSTTVLYGNGTWAAAGGGSSQWTTSGSNIYYTTGSVLVGTTTNPVSSAGVFSHTGDGYGLTVGDIATYTNRTGIYMRGGNENRIGFDGGGYLTFVQASTERARINGYGIGLNGAVPSSGVGITFPATQSASSDANTLDDYEEGTVTPTVRDYVYDVNCSYTLSSSSGQYTKIGRQVTYSFTMTFATFTAGNGQWFGVDLPFTPSASTSFVGTLDTSGVDWSGSPTTICIRSYLYGGSVTTMFGAMTDNAASSRIYSNGVSAGDTISGTITYFV